MEDIKEEDQLVKDSDGNIVEAMNQENDSLESYDSIHDALGDLHRRQEETDTYHPRTGDSFNDSSFFSNDINELTAGEKISEAELISENTPSENMQVSPINSNIQTLTVGNHARTVLRKPSEGFSSYTHSLSKMDDDDYRHLVVSARSRRQSTGDFEVSSHSRSKRESVFGLDLTFKTRHYYGHDDSSIFYDKERLRHDHENLNSSDEDIEDEDARMDPKQLVGKHILFTDYNKVENLKEYYYDHYPLLGLRKAVMILAARISLTCDRIIRHRYFEAITLFVIIANSIVLAIEDPTVSERTEFEQVADIVFLVLYTLEFLIKVFGMGFIIPKGAYLRDSWNILDFTIVVSAYIELIFQSSSGVNLQAFRAFRVLRPLRTISGIEGLKTLFTALLSAIPLLRDTIMVLLFFFLIFAIAGVQLFMGILTKRCINIETGSYVYPDEPCGGKNMCGEGEVCAKTLENPNYGVTNFDNILYGFLVIFQCVTLEGWTSVMNDVRRAFNDYAVLYFVPLVFIGAFFLLNLTLAVIKSSFSDTMGRHKKDPQRKREGMNDMEFYSLNTEEEESLFTRRGSRISSRSDMTGSQRPSFRGRGSFVSGNLQKSRDISSDMHDSQMSAGRENSRVMRIISQKSQVRRRMSLGNFGDEVAKAEGEVTINRSFNVQRSQEQIDGSQEIQQVTSSKDEQNTIYTETAGTTSSSDESASSSSSQTSSSSSSSASAASSSRISTLAKSQNLTNRSKTSGPTFQDDSILGKKSTQNKGLNELRVPDQGVEGSHTPRFGNIKVQPLKLNTLNGSNPQKVFTPSLANIRGMAQLANRHKRFTTHVTFKEDTDDDVFLDIVQASGDPQPSEDSLSYLQNQNSNSASLSRSNPHLKYSIRDPDENSFSSLTEEEMDKVETSLHFDTPLRPLRAMKNKNRNRHHGNHSDSNSSHTQSSSDDTNSSSSSSGTTSSSSSDDSDSFESQQALMAKLHGALGIPARTKSDVPEISLFQKGNNDYRLRRGSTAGVIGLRSLRLSPEGASGGDIRSGMRRSITLKAPSPGRRGGVLIGGSGSGAASPAKDTGWWDWGVRPGSPMRTFTMGTTATSAHGIRKQITRNITARSISGRSQLIVDKKMVLKTHQHKGVYTSELDVMPKKKQRDVERMKTSRVMEAQKYTRIHKRSKLLRYKIHRVHDEYGKLPENAEFVGDESVNDFSFSEFQSDQRDTLLHRDTVTPVIFADWSGDDILTQSSHTRTNDDIANVEDLNIIVWMTGPWLWAHKFQNFFREIVLWKSFENIMTLCVMLNTIALAVDHHGIDAEMANVLETLNLIFTIIFIAEMAIKLTGLGFKGYVRDTMNLFDGAIVIISIVELIFDSDGNGSTLQAFRVVRIFRTFRVLRVARLLRYLKSMMLIVEVVSKSLSSFVYIALLLLLFIYIYALFGMQLFGGSFSFYDGKPRANFDSFNAAFVTVFQILTLENWQEILYSGVRAKGPFTSFYFISWIFLGNFVLLNLFLAILLEGFESRDEAEDDEENDAVIEKTLTAEHANDHMGESAAEISPSNSRLEVANRGPSPVGRASFLASHNIQQLKHMRTTTFPTSPRNKSANISRSKRQMQKEGVLQPSSTARIDEYSDSDESFKLTTKEEAYSLVMFENILCQKSLYIFTQENKIRRLCYRFVKHERFETLILVLIFFNSLKLIVDTYFFLEDDDSLVRQISYYFDLFFTCVFTLEALLKSVAYGFVMEEHSYLRDGWNQLDFFIVVTGILDLILQDFVDLALIRILRLLRTLRPLRFISHNISMKIVVTALLESIGAILNVLILVGLVWLMFAIFGVSLFKGEMFYCSQDRYEFRTEAVCEMQIDQKTKLSFDWLRYDSNFDDVLQAMMTLFIVSSLEGWNDIMYHAVDTSTPDHGPIKNASPWAAYYFVAFILIGSFFLINLFIGVIFMHFNRAQRNHSHNNLFQTEEQKLWSDLQRIVARAKPDYESNSEPVEPFRKSLYKLVNHPVFDVFIMACILLNMLQMAISYEGAPDDYNQALEIVNLVFTAVFVLELILKVVAYGCRGYWNNTWNRFDAFVVLASLMDLTLTQFSSSSTTALRVGPQLARVLRVLRVSRLLRLAKSFEGLQTLIQTLLYVLPSLANVFSLLMLVFLIYAVLACYLFYEIKKGVVIDEYTNFQNFGMALVTLFRISTGEEWNKIMYDCLDPIECFDGENDCGQPSAPIFFLSFILICSYVVLNLFILVILEQFDKNHQDPNNPVQNFKEYLESFRKVWSAFSGQHRGTRMSQRFLVDFFKETEEPLGMGREAEHRQVMREIMGMELKSDNEGYVYFNELLFSAAKRNWGRIEHSDRSKLEEGTTVKRLARTRQRIMAKGGHTYGKSREKFMNEESVNPFLSTMYLRITLKCWLNYMRREVAKIREFEEEQERKNREESDAEGKTEPTTTNPRKSSLFENTAQGLIKRAVNETLWKRLFAMKQAQAVPSDSEDESRRPSRKESKKKTTFSRGRDKHYSNASGDGFQFGSRRKFSDGTNGSDSGGSHDFARKATRTMTVLARAAQLRAFASKGSKPSFELELKKLESGGTASGVESGNERRRTAGFQRPEANRSKFGTAGPVFQRNHETSSNTGADTSRSGNSTNRPLMSEGNKDHQDDTMESPPRMRLHRIA